MKRLTRSGVHTQLQRRDVLRNAILGVAGMTLGYRAFGQYHSESLDVHELGANLVQITGAGANVVVLEAGDALLMIDGGLAERSQGLLDFVAARWPGRRIQTLFNTNWSWEHTGSNQALGSAGTTIVAHEKTRLRLATAYYLPEEDRYQKALPAEAHPTKTFYTTGDLAVGGERIDYGYLLEAHTDGDIYVFLRNANVLAVGDAVSPLRDPALDWFGGGWLGGRVDSLARLLAISDERTQFVPSYGPVVSRAQVQAEHDIMLKLFERMVELVRKGDSAEDILAAGVMDGLDRSFDDPLKFVHDAHKGLWAHHNTLSPDVV